MGILPMHSEAGTLGPRVVRTTSGSAEVRQDRGGQEACIRRLGFTQPNLHFFVYFVSFVIKAFSAPYTGSWVKRTRLSATTQPWPWA